MVNAEKLGIRFFKKKKKKESNLAALIFSKARHDFLETIKALETLLETKLLRMNAASPEIQATGKA